MELWNDFLESCKTPIYGIQVGRFLLAFLIILVSIVFRKVFTFIVIKYVLSFAKKTRFKFDQLLVENLRRPMGFFFILLGIFLATIVLTKPNDIGKTQSALEIVQHQLKTDFEVEPKVRDPKYDVWFDLSLESEALAEEQKQLTLEKTEADTAVATKEKAIAETFPVEPDAETPEHVAYTTQQEELTELKASRDALTTSLQENVTKSNETANKLAVFQVAPEEGSDSYNEYSRLQNEQERIKEQLSNEKTANTWFSRINSFMIRLIKAVSAFLVFWIILNMTEVVCYYLKELAGRTDTSFDDSLIPLVRKTLRVFVIIMGALVIFQNMGYSLTSVLAGLGLGGLAFALAAKDTISNFFGSITVIIDHPYRIGDWIKVGNSEGSVEEIGFRSTRIRTFYNSQIVIPNSEMANATIDNLGMREYRRKVLNLALTYDTPPFKIEAFCEGVREFIRTHPYTRKDYYQVYFKNFNDSSLDVLLYCFLKVPDWGTELREWHRMFISILKLADRLGVEFAFPTQTIHLANQEGNAIPASKLDKDVPTPLSLDEAYELGRKLAREINLETVGEQNSIPLPVDATINDSVLTNYKGQTK